LAPSEEQTGVVVEPAVYVAVMHVHEPGVPAPVVSLQPDVPPMLASVEELLAQSAVHAVPPHPAPVGTLTVAFGVIAVSAAVVAAAWVVLLQALVALQVVPVSV
jgi:hypothetical protein